MSESVEDGIDFSSKIENFSNLIINVAILKFEEVSGFPKIEIHDTIATMAIVSSDAQLSTLRVAAECAIVPKRFALMVQIATMAIVPSDAQLSTLQPNAQLSNGVEACEMEKIN